MKAMLAASRLQMGEGTSMPDGKTSLAIFEIDTNGLEAAWTQLWSSCPAAPNNARPPASASPSVSAVPAQ
jgi:hypothetical protein